jgi:hypothetical protein
LRFSGLILEHIFVVFLGSSYRETAKNAIKKIDGKNERKKGFFSQLFRPKVFDMDLWFLGSPCRETAKNAIKKIDGKRRKEKSFFFLNFFGQKFLTWIFPKMFWWCF